MVDAISRAANANNINYTGALTPDAMLLYCQSRLKGLDDQMEAQFAKQKQYRAGTAGLNDLVALFNGPANTAKGVDGRFLSEGSVDPHTFQVEADAKFDEVINSLPPGPERTQVENMRDQFHKGFYDKVGQGGDGDWQYVYTKGECKAVADSLEQVSKDLSSSAELDMLNLNSLMSQRQMAVQMCTNMISALGETQKAIAQKLGS